MNIKFLGEYIKNVREVGAVAPSSRFLARKMIGSIDFDTAKVIIEYGPGTGVFTEEILKHMRPSTKLLVIETNLAFYERLQAKYGERTNVEIINASAADVGSLHGDRLLPPPDYIVSGLPFTALPAHVSHAILTATSQLLKNDGEFITFQYSLLKKRVIASHFKNIQVTCELRNIPPAYILRCRK